MTGIVASPAFMGAPVILVERVFSGLESISALKAATAVSVNTDAVKEKDNGDGIKEVENVQELMSVGNEVRELSNRMETNFSNKQSSILYVVRKLVGLETGGSGIFSMR